MPQITNSFNNGMQRDNAKSLPVENTYYNAQNLRLLNTEKYSSKVLVNIAGNEESFQLPVCYNAYKLNYLKDFLEGAISVEIDGIARDFTSSSTTRGEVNEDLYNFLISKFPPTTANFNFDGLEISAVNSERDLIIQSDSSDLKIEQISEGHTIYKPIGVGLLRDSFILFTLGNSSASNGQVWKIDYLQNKTTPPTIKLISNRDDYNFSEDHPIKALGKYENEFIQRVYITDFFNPLRSINIQSNTLYLDSINITSAITFTPPIITDINVDQGELPAGSYQFVYRLKRGDGEGTGFSRVSKQIQLSTISEAVDYTEYRGVYADNTGEALNTQKAISVKIKDLDLGYDVVEIAVIYNFGFITTVTSITEEPITSDTIEILYTGSENTLKDLTPEEVLIPGVNFEKVKTLEAFQNRLIIANVKTTAKDILKDEFEFVAETKRYQIGNSTEYPGKENPYNKLSTRGLHSEHYKYRKDGILGGEGPNIKYKFVMKEFVLDTLGYPGTYSERYTSERYDIADSETLNGEDYPMGEGWKSYKNPLFTSLYKQHRRGEIYRYGVVFFDVYGNPGFTSWIEDIRFPDHYDENEFGESYNIVEYRGSKLYGKALGIEFEVTIPDTLKKVTSGYSIVRSKKTDGNSTLLEQGFHTEIVQYEYDKGVDNLVDLDTDGGTDPRLLQYIVSGPDNRGFTSENMGDTDRADGYGDEESSVKTSGHRTVPEKSLFDFPDHTVLGYNKINPGNKILPIQSLNYLYKNSSDYSIGAYDQTGAFTGTQNPLGFWAKAYVPTVVIDEKTQPFNYYEFPLDRSKKMPKAGRATTDSSLFGDPSRSSSEKIRFFNYSLPAIKDDNKEKRELYWMYGAGVESTYVFHGYVGKFKEEIIYDKLLINPTSPNNRKIAVNIYRELEKQYGGLSASALASTQYISCDDFTRMDTLEGNISKTTVFGGDTFLCNFDHLRTVPNYRYSENGNVVSSINSQSADDGGDTTDNFGVTKDNKYIHTIETALIYPVESSLNLDLRDGLRFANNGLGYEGIRASTGPLIGSGAYTEDAPTLDFRASKDIDFETYVPKPFNYEEVQEFDNRAYISGPKFNGEKGDSWSKFKVNDFLDVDGNYGPINELMLFNDKMHFWQDRAFGVLSVNPRAVVTSTDGIETQLGSGAGLERHQYISNSTGCKHQWGIGRSPSSLTWFDILNQKLYMYNSQGLNPFSDSAGLYSFFAKEVDNNLKYKDNPLKFEGIHIAYDYQNSSFLYTFLNPKENKKYDVVSGRQYYFGDIIKKNNIYYKVLETSKDLKDTQLEKLNNYIPGFTLEYSELFQSFQQFITATPTMYLNSKDVLVSPDPLNISKYYVHNVDTESLSNKCKFYGVYYPSELSYNINQGFQQVKVFDNISFQTEVKTQENVDLPLKTFNYVEFTTAFQSTGLQKLVAGTAPYYMDGNIERDARIWNMFINRNNDSSFERLRDTSMTTNIRFINSEENNKFLLHYINTSVRLPKK
jgi:hypothetical protein